MLGKKANKFTDLFAYTIQDHNLLLENAHLRHKTFLSHQVFPITLQVKRLSCKVFFLIHLIKGKSYILQLSEILKFYLPAQQALCTNLKADAHIGQN